MANYLPWIILLVVAAYQEVRLILARAEFDMERKRWEGERDRLLDRIQAQSPDVLPRVHAKAMADEALAERREARGSERRGGDTDIAGAPMPPSESSIAGARMTFEDVVSNL